MKKLLLSLAMVLGFIAVNAATVTINPEAWSGKWSATGDGFTATIDGYTITLAKGTSSTALIEPTEYHIRVYQGAVMTITAPSGALMKEITFTVDQNSKAASADDVTYSSGWTLVGTPSTSKGSSFGASSEGLATFSVTAGKQIRIASIVISDEAGTTPDPIDPDPVDPDPVVPGEDGEITIAAPFAGLTNLPGDNTVGGYTLTFLTNSGSTKPQVYQETAIRMYANNSLTISGTKLTKIVFTLSSDAGYRYTTFTPDAGALNPAQAAGDTQITWEGNVSEVTFTVGEKATLGTDGETKAGQIRIASITIYGEGGGDVPPTPQGTTFTKVNSLDNGLYVFVCNGQLATPEAQSKTYGRMSLVNATIDGNNITTDEKNAFTINITNGQATIKDSYGRFYGMDTEHLTSFQFYTEINEGCYYTYAFEGDNVKFTNVLNPTCIVSQTQGAQGTWYTNVAPAAEPTVFNLPVLYKKNESTMIADVIADENAPVEFYNLQGVRVENPSNGIFIRRQGNNVSKVLVK